MAGRNRETGFAPRATTSTSTATAGDSRRSQWFDPARDQLLPIPLEPRPVQDDVSSRLLRSLDRTPSNGLSGSTSTFSLPLTRRPGHGSDIRASETQTRSSTVAPHHACTQCGGSGQCSPSSQTTAELAAADVGDERTLPLKGRSSSAVNMLSPVPPHPDLPYRRGWSTGDMEPFVARPPSYPNDYTTRPLPPIRHHLSQPTAVPRNDSVTSAHVHGKRISTADPNGQSRCSGITEIPGRGTFYAYDDGSLLPTHVDGEPVNPLWGLTKANRPRKRLPRACKACREEKSRCEPTVTGCVRCDISNRRCSNNTS